ncbi:MAG: hypothetical protein KAU95_00825, partial [Candidatus Aenigmarchaeota archaeon]|nr:hypothetical protein [Candidatus Aenigmarchaeota archaeon]
GTIVEPDGVNWTIENKTICENLTCNWVVNETMGYHLITITVTGNATTEDSVNISIWDYSAVNLTYVSATEIGRYYSEIDLEAEVYNFRNETNIESYACYWSDSQLGELGTSWTNSSGKCDFTITTNCSFHVGPHNFSVLISEDGSKFYKPKENYSTDLEGVNLTEQLNISITAPGTNSILHRTENIGLTALIQDECGILTDTNVNWVLTGNGTENLGANNGTGSWQINSSHALGIFVLNATAEKQFYDLDTDLINLSIYGWAGTNITKPSPGPKHRGDLLNISCEIYDINTSEKIQNYPAEIWKTYSNQSGNYTGKLYNNTTNSTGEIYYSWNTSGEEMGNYTLTCNITHSSALFYNISYIDSVDIILQDFLNLSTETHSELVYRDDEFNKVYNQETEDLYDLTNTAVFEMKLTDDRGINIENAIIHLFANLNDSYEEIGNCSTNSTGE